MSVTVSKNKCGQFFASVLVEMEIIQKPKTGRKIGLDLGLKTFLTGSDGFTVENPKYFRESQAKLKQAQRQFSRKVKGSTRYKKARLIVPEFTTTLPTNAKTSFSK